MDCMICPISLEVMVDPVIDAEGNTFERENIVKWLTEHGTSPLTRNPMRIEQLKPNRALRDLIENFKSNPQQQIPHQQNITQRASTTIKTQSICSPTLETYSLDSHFMVKVLMEDGDNKEHTPLDLVCVVDISSSMLSSAVLKDENNREENHGYTVIDIVAHSIQSLVAILDEKDRLSIVLFNHSAILALPLTVMNRPGKLSAKNILEEIQPDGATNLWAGIQMGLDQLNNRPEGPKRLGAVLILTDGVPNFDPPRGHIPTLEKYFINHVNVAESCLLSTFGFGYSLDSDLMKKIADVGNGTYSFIPESGLVGSVFVNCIANLRCTIAWRSKLYIKANNNVLKVVGHSQTYENGEICVPLGSLQWGQPRHIIFEVKDPSLKHTPLEVRLQFNQVYDMAKTCVDTITNPTARLNDFQYTEIQVQIQRAKVISTIQEGLKMYAKTKKLNNSAELVEATRLSIMDSPVAEHAHVVALVQDLEEQIQKAFSREEWFNKWGKHYLPSLAFAHLAQQANNFKDPGIQVYGGSLFQRIQSTAEDAFLSLPPLKRKKTTNQSSRQEPQQNLSHYYNVSGGCFSGESLVLMSDGSMKRVDMISKGDTVHTPSGPSEVLCVVMNVFSAVNGPKDKCIRFKDGLVITPYHPVRIDQKWHFPCELNNDLLIDSLVPYPEVMYDFVLQKGHVMEINNIECITLGHGFQDEVACHDYFGTTAVIEDLMRLEGWSHGKVVTYANQYQRDNTSHLITHLERTEAA